jgi:putative serine protease PepD
MDPASPPSPPRRRPPRWLAGALVPAVAGAGVALGTVAATGNLGGGGTTVVREVPSSLTSVAAAPATRVEAALVRTSAAKPKSVQQIVRDASPGIVRITTGAGAAQALGTGFLIDRAGHVLTNAHVVGDASSVTVTFRDGSTAKGRVLGSDPSTDLAVVKVSVPTGDARPLPLGRSGGLVVGDSVVAIGNPLGLDGTATTGIVSALKRDIESPNGAVIQNAIQTDAAINHGNSGGPLLDSLGRVIGINSQIASESGGNDGIGFAVPIDTIRPIAASIIASGRAEHAWLGILGSQMTPAVAKQLGLSRPGVAVIGVTAGSPAAKAGLRAATTPRDASVPRGGDVIIAINGAPVRDNADVSQQIASRRVGDRITFTVWRDGRAVTLHAELANRPASLRP